MEINSNFSEKAKKDYDLVSRAKEGDQIAYAELMERYKDPIYFMCLKMIGKQDDSEDLTLEVFGKAFNRIHQYTPQYAFSTWLFKIATNHCIDFIRKKRLSTTSIDEAMGDDKGSNWKMELSSNSKDPEEKFIEQQKIKLMREGVGKLKMPYRRLIELRYFEEFSYEEIATELDIPLGTVKAQLFRARALLSGLMEKAKPTI